jgi:hypothetical protein
MLKLSKVVFFFASLFLFVSASAQELSVSQMVSKMYDTQAEMLDGFKSEQLYLRQKGDMASIANAVNADMKVNGVTVRDFIASRNLALIQMRHSKDAGLKAIAAFFDSRDMQPAEELILFNDYLRAKYAERTAATSASSINLDYSASTGLVVNMPKKVKVTSNSDEPVTGGKLWMFSNGIRVIYKQDKNAKDIAYTLMTRGGFGAISDLEYGQGAYVGDLLPLFKVRGMNGSAFRNMLALNGISMNAEVTLMDLSLRGYAPKNSLELLIQALLSVTVSAKADPVAYEYFCQQPRRSSKEAVIDSLFRPDFVYTPYKYNVALSKDLMQRALDQCFADRFSNIDDGIIILTANLSETQVQTLLNKYLGAFKTNSQYAIFPHLQYQQRTGKVTYVTRGRPEVCCASSLFLSLSADSYLTLRMAEIIIQSAVRKAFKGSNVSLSSSFEVYPYERYSLLVTVEGLSSSADAQNVWKIIEECAEEEYDKDDIRSFRTQLVGVISEEMSDNLAKADFAIGRYCGRKDFLTNYQSRLEKISPDQVTDILGAIAEASRVEYIQR